MEVAKVSDEEVERGCRVGGKQGVGREAGR